MVDQDERYFLQNETAGYVGNSPMWWAKGDSGYTPWPDEAERFTLEEATRIVLKTQGSHRWAIWGVTDVLSVVRFTVDMQTLRKHEPVDMQTLTKAGK